MEKRKKIVYLFVGVLVAYWLFGIYWAGLEAVIPIMLWFLLLLTGVLIAFDVCQPSRTATKRVKKEKAR